MWGVVTTRRIVVALALGVVLIALSVVAVVADDGPLRPLGWVFMGLGAISVLGVVRAWWRRRSERAR